MEAMGRAKWVGLHKMVVWGWQKKVNSFREGSWKMMIFIIILNRNKLYHEKRDNNFTLLLFIILRFIFFFIHNTQWLKNLKLMGTIQHTGQKIAVSLVFFGLYRSVHANLLSKYDLDFNYIHANSIKRIIRDQNHNLTNILFKDIYAFS